MKNHKTNPRKRHSQGAKKYAQVLYKLLEIISMTLMMPATGIGSTHQAFTLAQFFYDWMKPWGPKGTGIIKCEGSKRIAEMKTSSPAPLHKPNQLKTF